MKAVKRSILIFLFVLALFLIASCSRQQAAVCGDDICDEIESCACDDCKTQEKCIGVSIIGKCNDRNDCTEDIFNELTKQCEHRILENCCGNEKCESQEHCNLETYETACSKDCPFECPAKVTMTKFSCASESCEKISENTFRLKRSSSPDKTAASAITATLTNIGERSSGNINSEFRCDAGLSGIVSGDNSTIYFLKFRDRFAGNDETTMVNSRVSKLGNKADYTVDFEIGHNPNKNLFELKCTAILQDGVNVDISQRISLSF